MRAGLSRGKKRGATVGGDNPDGRRGPTTRGSEAWCRRGQDLQAMKPEAFGGLGALRRSSLVPSGLLDAGGHPSGGRCQRPPIGRKMPKATLLEEYAGGHLSGGERRRPSLGPHGGSGGSVGGKRSGQAHREIGSRSSALCQAAQAASDTVNTLKASSNLYAKAVLIAV
ncbi:hypothetical protein GUJ93_ZPchr0015g6912 [Zizania palustris]|uniref:Uncharacterized protein n=1 Tax=Zizania palustris TaxID=103762 RepID=A0A8J5TM18_ZIZPA|nr:hypothetical protein GUJ93_ZPchr0015g6912 [Zizania palustris]